ncbi:MAG TPA: hypothetical protein VIQ27_05565 [Gemmatimonadales bacterium]
MLAVARSAHPDIEEHDLRSSARAGLTYGVAFLGGAGLFFLTFAAIFNGSWSLLLFFLLAYVGAGALAVWVGHVAPGPLALALAAPAVPWVLWLFPASIPEAGLGRALLWPGLVVLLAALGWFGGKAVAVAVARRAVGSRAA